MLQALPIVFVLAGLVLYTVLAGADFGAGFWQLFAGRGPNAERLRAHAHHSMAPVWEANHVWLIFVLTVFWTAYPHAFGSIASTLAVPLFIAAIGIIFRGAAYALSPGASSPRESSVIDTIFSISSILTPFALGAAIGAIATDRVPVGNATGHLISSWLNPTSVFIGILAVASSAYLAAVYLSADAARLGDDDVEAEFRRRALGAGVLAGATAVAGLFVVNDDYHKLYDSLLTGAAVAGVIVSVLAGLTTLALVYSGRFEAARYSAAAAVAAIIAGWAIARWPTILPGLTVHQAAAGHDTLVWIVVAVLVGGAILFPSLGLLFRLTLTGRFRADEIVPADIAGVAADGFRGLRPRLLVRSALASLIAGVGLLNVADARLGPRDRRRVPPWLHRHRLPGDRFRHPRERVDSTMTTSRLRLGPADRCPCGRRARGVPRGSLGTVLPVARAIHLDELETIHVAGVTWRPIRRALGITGFGVNGYSAARGEQLIEEHDETGGGSGHHEELYLVVSGHAAFSVDEGEIDAPAGTLVFVPEAASRRSAVALSDGTTAIVVGGSPGAITPSPWEYYFAALPAAEAGDRARAYDIAAAGLVEHPDHPSLHYNLACYASLAGQRDRALEHLNRAVEGNPQVRSWAATDTDLDSIRSDPRYPH